MTDGDPPFPAPGDRLVLESGCDRCPALAAARTEIAWGNGPLDADVFVVGEAPAAGDPDAEQWRGGNLTGAAYTSRHSGRRVRSLLAAAGYGDRTFYTNAVKCFPADDDASDGGDVSNREPTPEERATCRRHLASELEAVAPAVVVPTGKHATASVLAFDGRTVEGFLGGFLEGVLEPFESPELGGPVLPLLHPSYEAVWRGRLGYDAEEYREAVAAALDRLVGDE